MVLFFRKGEITTKKLGNRNSRLFNCFYQILNSLHTQHLPEYQHHVDTDVGKPPWKRWLNSGHNSPLPVVKMTNVIYIILTYGIRVTLEQSSSISVYVWGTDIVTDKVKHGQSDKDEKRDGEKNAKTNCKGQKKE